MKQAMKRFGAMLLTMAMLLSLAVTGVSAEAAPAVASGDKTVNITFKDLGSNNGTLDTVNAYRVIKYNSGFNDFEDANDLGDKTSFWEYIKADHNDVVAYLKDVQESDLRTLLKNFMAGMTESGNNALPTITKSTTAAGVLEAVEPGYYILRVESPSKIYKTMLLFVGYENGKLVAKMDGSDMAGTDNAYIVTVKSEKGPQIAKYVFDDRTDTALSTVDNWKSAAASEVGKEVNFAIKVTLPNYPDDANVTLTLNDTLKNLKYEGTDFSDIAVYYQDTNTQYKKIDNAVLAGAPVNNADGTQTMNIGLDYSKLRAYIADETAFYVYYKATLLEGAVTAEDGSNHQSGTNTVSMNYTVETSSGKYTENTENKTVTVYTYNFKLDKTYAGNNDLTGAEFSVYMTEPNDNNVQAVKFTKATDGTYYYPDTNGSVTSIPANFEIRGLDVNTQYYVKEVKTAAGYYLPTSYFTLELSGGEEQVGNVLNGNLKYTDESDYKQPSSFVAKEAVDQALVTNGHGNTTTPNYGAINSTKKYQYDVKLNNSSTPVLPSTGGMGTTLFTVGGVALLALAAAMLILRRRKN